jgi:hypothetical protein
MSRFDRQSFLGADSETKLYGATIGLVGLGGGGSQIVQQTGHLGIGGYVLVDPDHIEETNINRLIGGTLADVEAATTKVAIGERLLRGLQKRPRIVAVQDTWHNATGELKRCDIIVGAVDSFKERDQLERFARRHLIPYIDVGMDVHHLGGQKYLIGGQVILSMPGKACLRCCGLITEERLAMEAKKYGAAGSRPQVVWSNGVLASTAVGLITQLLTPWYTEPPEFVYLDHDGNRGTLMLNDRMESLRKKICPHHPSEETGDPLFDVREFNRLIADLAARKGELPSTPAPTGVWKRLWAAIAKAMGVTSR